MPDLADDSFMTVDEHRFTVDRAVLTVTRLPWGELSLQMNAEGRGDVWRRIMANLYDVRTPGRTPGDLDGIVLEAAIGWREDPHDPESTFATHHLYVDDHFDLVENRVSLHRVDDRRTRIGWTASTTAHINEYCRQDLRSRFEAALMAELQEGEFQRLTCIRIEGTDRVHNDAVIRVSNLLTPWLDQKTKALVQQGWFEGRSFASVDLVLSFGHDMSIRRPEVRPDRMVRIRVPAPLAWLARREPADVAAEIQRNIDRSLEAIAGAYPTGPRFLR